MKKTLLICLFCALTLGVEAQNINLSTSTPAAPAGSTNVTFQKDASSPVNISGYVPASGVVISAKSASYTLLSTDFSSSSLAPKQLIFTLSATGQAATLPSTAPATGACTIVENSLASYPYVLAVVTGGSTTLDGTAYTTAATSIALAPGQSEWICSDSTNYFSQGGQGVLKVVTANNGGVWMPILNGALGAATMAANQPTGYVFNLPYMVKASNITYDITVGVAAATCDFGIYAINGTAGTLMTHTGSQACATSSSIVKAAASPAITLPPGTYAAMGCSSSASVTVEGNNVTIPQGVETTSGSVTGSVVGGAAACTAGVLPASVTLTVSAAPNIYPGFLVTP